MAFGANILKTAVISGHESVGIYRRESVPLLGATHVPVLGERLYRVRVGEAIKRQVATPCGRFE